MFWSATLAKNTTPTLDAHNKDLMRLILNRLRCMRDWINAKVAPWIPVELGHGSWWERRWRIDVQSNNQQLDRWFRRWGFYQCSSEIDSHHLWMRPSAVHKTGQNANTKLHCFLSWCSHNLIEQVFVTVVDHAYEIYIKISRTQLWYSAHDLVINFVITWDTDSGNQPTISCIDSTRWQSPRSHHPWRTRRSSVLEARHRRWIELCSQLHQYPSGYCPPWFWVRTSCSSRSTSGGRTCAPILQHQLAQSHPSPTLPSTGLPLYFPQCRHLGYA